MAKDIDYIGIDSNTSLKPVYDKMIKFYKPHSKSTVRMLFNKAEAVDYRKIRDVDVIFTSPPFYKKEVYNGMPTYTSYKHWEETFLFTVIRGSMQCLKRGGVLALHIPPDIKDSVRKLLGEPYKVIDISRHHVSRVYNGKKTHMTIQDIVYCWKKKAIRALQSRS
jgi:hypothetical protein